jgi:hypothetical protein
MPFLPCHVNGALFQAQSGLASSDDLLPSHLADFDSVNTNYQMTGDELVVGKAACMCPT